MVDKMVAYLYICDKDNNNPKFNLLNPILYCLLNIFTQTIIFILSLIYLYIHGNQNI